jgi:hypothetical protein
VRNDSKDIIYQITETPISFLSKRDMVMAREFKIFENGFVMLGKSTEHENYPVKKEMVS